MLPPSDRRGSTARQDAYAAVQLKDDKLGTPLGLSEECPAMTCPDRVESRFARVSTANLQANLRGFRRLFQGCGENGAGIGFDDWLREVGNGNLADRQNLKPSPDPHQRATK